MTFIGHSKGGAEAAANAVATNKNSIIFNPATVNLEAYGLDSSNYSASMTAFIVKGDAHCRRVVQYTHRQSGVFASTVRRTLV